MSRMQVKLGGEKTCTKQEGVHLLNDKQKLPFADDASGFHMEEDLITCHARFKRELVYGNEEMVDTIIRSAAKFLGAPSSEHLQYSEPEFGPDKTIFCRFRYPGAVLFVKRGPDIIQ